jgi:hypothetical protein
MTIFAYLQYIHKYLHSVRNITDNGKKLFAFDMKFPAKWDIYKYLSDQELIHVKEQEVKDSTVKFYTFFSQFIETEVNDNYDRIIHIIDKCVEEEKKLELMNQKIQELKSKFNELSLEDLESLVFKTKEDEKKQELTGS